MKISVVPLSMLDAVWPVAKPLIDKALMLHPHLKSDGLWAALCASTAQLILVIDGGKLKGAIAIESVTFAPDLHTVNIIALGAGRGFYSKYLAYATDWLEEHARSLGATRLIATGRCGWERYFKRQGAQMQTLLMGWKDIGRPANDGAHDAGAAISPVASGRLNGHAHGAAAR